MRYILSAWTFSADIGTGSGFKDSILIRVVNRGGFFLMKKKLNFKSKIILFKKFENIFGKSEIFFRKFIKNIFFENKKF